MGLVMRLSRRTVAFFAYAFLVASVVGCAGEPAPCIVATQPYFAQFAPLQSAGLCEVLAGDEVGLQRYSSRPPGSSDADLRWSLAIQSLTMGNLAIEPGVSTNMVRDFALGDFPPFADEKNICRAETLEAAEADIPERTIDLGTNQEPMMFPAVQRRETWSNVEMYVAADMPGLRFSADVVIADLVAGCETKYSVSALSPAVFCGREQYDDMGNVTYEVDDTLCLSAPDVEAGRPGGSGIDARFKTHCDPISLHCVLDGSPLDLP